MKISAPVPIRFADEDDVSVSALWKISEFLIDFGGEGRKIIAINSKSNNAVYVSDPVQKQTLTSFFASILKVTSLALIYLTVVGAISHICIVLYNRRNHHFIHTPNYFFHDLKTVYASSKQTVEGHGHTLFEGIKFVDQEKIHFMKNLLLENMEFDNLDCNPNFIIRNNISNEILEFSNRDPSKGEIRGRVFRNLLDRYKISDPNQSLYTAISKIITSKDSDYFKYFINQYREISTVDRYKIIDDFCNF